MKKHIKLLFLVLAIASAGLVSQSFKDDYFEITRNLDIFTTLFRELNIYYVDETNPGDLMKTGIDAMLQSLDPYTNYIPESNIEDYRFMTTGQYGGIGALIGRKGDFVIITDPYEGFAAQSAGLQAGDKILEVDGKSTKGKSTSDVSQILKGQPNTNVKLKIERPGTDDPFEVELERQEIKVKSVPYSGMIADGIGYVKLRSFTDKCGQEVREAIEKLQAENEVKSLVLDLRSNPGGLLHEAVNITNLFIDKGKDVVSTKGKLKEWDKSYKALNTPLDTKMKIVVLVNSRSASASEIVSGALQDFDRGLVIGQKTFGKGLVQTTRPLSYNSQLKITTAKYYIPSGRCIQALDYSHRNEDGSVGSIPDTLKSEFKTTKGRVVYDGGGIEPDYSTERKKYSKITQSLISKYLIFDFATEYKLKNESISPAGTFALNESDFTGFVNFLSDKDYDYTTQSEEAIEQLKDLTKEDKYYEGLKTEYEALKNKIAHNKQEDIQTNKNEIMNLLQDEIVSRYYYEKGRIESSFVHDKDVQMAIMALKDETVYTSMFNRDYNPSN